MSATRLQALQYNAIESINAIVECKGVTFADRNAAIKLLAQHLLARAAQTEPRPEDPVFCAPEAHTWFDPANEAVAAGGPRVCSTCGLIEEIVDAPESPCAD